MVAPVGQQPVVPPPAAQGTAGSAAAQSTGIIAPHDSATISTAAADGDISVPDNSQPADPASEFCRLTNQAIGRPLLGNSAKEWLEGTLTGSRRGTIHLDNEWRKSFAKALGVDEDEVTEEVLDQLFGNGDGTLDEDVEITVLNDRLKSLMPQLLVRRAVCNENFINILASDGIRWIDQNEAAADVDVVALARGGNHEVYDQNLRVALSIYIEEAPTDEEKMRRQLLAQNLLNGGAGEIPESVKRNLRYAYMAGLDNMLTIHHIELDEDLDLTDPKVRQDFLQGLFALYVQNGDLPVNNKEFLELYEDLGQDEIDAEDLAAIAEWRRTNIPVNPETLPAPDQAPQPPAN